MKTTLIIPDNLVRELKRLAAERGQTLSAVVAEVMRRGLERRPFPEDLPLLTADTDFHQLTFLRVVNPVV